MTNTRSRMGAYGRMPKSLIRDSTISPGAKMIVAMVDEVAGHEDITVAILGEWMGCSERQARRYVREAEESGWLEVRVRFDNAGRQITSEYIANAVPFQTDGTGREATHDCPPSPKVSPPREATSVPPYKSETYETSNETKTPPRSPPEGGRSGDRSARASVPGAGGP